MPELDPYPDPSFNSDLAPTVNCPIYSANGTFTVHPNAQGVNTENDILSTV